MALVPLLLRPDNFTPPTRTPWGGTKILSQYKADLVLPAHSRHEVVGESWEISVEPDFPSRIDEDAGRLLSDVLQHDPETWLGRDHALRYGASTPLLVKLLDAADDLSVQVHPGDDYAGLAPDETGKPEAWLVLEAEPGSGLYMGLPDGVSRKQIETALRIGADLTPMLNFVPVEPGDFFLIRAGTVHAVGKGVTLIEPQFVTPGKRGVTYRFWDWNRRYDAAGRPDPSGEPRELHIEHALAVTHWESPRPEWMRSPSGVMPVFGNAARFTLARTRHLRVDRLQGSGPMRIELEDRMHGVTVLRGHLRITGDGFEVCVARGRSAVIPATLGTLQLELGSDTDACLTATGP